MTIGKRIKEARKKRKLTQKQLCELTGIAEITIRQYEADKYIPKIGYLQKISQILQIPLYELLGASNDVTWPSIANNFPDSQVVEYDDDVNIVIGSSGQAVYIERIEKYLPNLNIEGLIRLEGYLSKLRKNELYSQEPPTTE